MKKFCLAAFVFLLGGAVSALEESATAPADVISSAVTSPHVPWAIPLADGPLRILMVAPRYTLRDAVELQQRLESRIEVVPLWDGTHLGYDPQYPPADLEHSSEQAVLELLNKRLSDAWDVLILANFDLDILPETAQQLMIDRVGKGAGMVLAHLRASRGGPIQNFLAGLSTEQDTASITRGVAETGGRGWQSGKPVLAASMHGEGRVVQFQFAGDPPQTHALLPQLADPLQAPPAYLDNAFSLVIRAVLWSANRAPATYITGLVDIAPKGPADEEIPPDLPEEYVQQMRDSVLNPPSHPFQIQLNAEADKDYDVVMQLRSSDRYVQLAAPRLSSGLTVMPVEILSLPGVFFVDIWLKSRKGVVDWYSQRMDLQMWPYVRDLKASKTSLLPHDTLELSVEVRAILRQSVSGTIYARATDSFGRVVAETAVTVTQDGGRIVIPMQFADLLAPMVRINVFGLEGPKRDFLEWELMGDLGQTLVLPVRRPVQKTEPLLVVSSTAMEEFNARHFLATLQAHGAGAVYGPGGDAGMTYAAESRLRFIPEIGGYHSNAAVDSVLRQPCLADPGYVQAQDLQVQGMTEFHLAGGSGLYSLGSGNCIVSSDENVCQCSFCLDTFHRWLEREYRNLEVLNAQWGTACASWEEVRPLGRAEARTTAQYAPWVDFRTCMDNVFTGFHQRLRDAVHTADVSGLAGARLLSAENPMHGYDWPKLLGALDFTVVESDALLLERAVAFGKKDSWNGVALPGDADQKTLGYWTWNGLLHQMPLAWSPAGFGTAAEGANMAAVWPDGRLSKDHENLESSLRAIQSGLGELLLRATPNPASVAILESTASRHLNEVLMEEDAGSLAAESRFLRALYWLGHTPRMVSTKALLDGLGADIRVLLLPAVTALSEAEIQALRRFADNGGVLIADTPPGTHDQHGVPRKAAPLADLLGEGATATPHLVLHWGDGEQALQHFRDKLDTAGCAPAIVLAGNDAQFQGQRFQFQLGQAAILALLADPDATGEQRARIALPKKSHAYDLRTALPVVGARKFTARVQPGDLALFAVLPYDVQEVLLLLPETVFAGRRLEVHAGVAARKATAGEHLIRIDLQPEFGDPLPCYRQILRCPGGAGSTYIPLALNEKPGRYMLTATDILSGVSAQGYVDVGFIADPRAGLAQTP